MHIYISGRVTGEPDYFSHFMQAETDLIKQGYIPINPVRNEPDGESWTYYMRHDLIKLCSSCDKIYMLKGWRRSKGARLEHHIAKKLGFKIIYEH